MAQIPLPKSGGGVFSDQIGEQELPPEGTYIATILDIKDRFQVERPKFGEPGNTEIVDLTTFLFGFRDVDNNPYKISSRDMVISGNEKSNLFKFLKGILGKAPKVGWDYCELKGTKCQISIEHTPSKDGSRMFANISSVAPSLGNTAPAAATKSPAKKAAPAPVAPPPVETEDLIPF